MPDHKTRGIAGLFALAAVAALCSCGGNDNATGTGNDPILTISNDWKEEGNLNHHFSFASGDDGKRSGVFTGDESLADSTYNLVGSWDKGKISFTVSRARLATYAGQFNADNPKRLVFQSGSATLVLVQGAVR